MPAFLPDSVPSISCGGFVMRPESRGRVMISRPDSKAPLEIDPNYLASEYDQRVSIDATRYVRQVFDQPALAKFRPRNIFQVWITRQTNRSSMLSISMVVPAATRRNLPNGRRRQFGR